MRARTIVANANANAIAVITAVAVAVAVGLSLLVARSSGLDSAPVILTPPTDHSPSADQLAEGPEADEARPDRPHTAPDTESETAPDALQDRVTAEEAELDRLIELFTARSLERGESIEYRSLGSLLLERARPSAGIKDYRAALDAFTASLELAPDNPDALVGQGRAALGVHDFAAALAAGAALERHHPTNLEGMALTGDAALAVGDYAAAGHAYESLALAIPDEPAVLVRLAQVEVVRSGMPGARRLASEALVQAEARLLQPADLAFYETFAGRLAYDAGDPETATTLLEQAVLHAPDNHGALGELARVLAAGGDLDAAITALARANQLVPEPDHLVLLGDLRAKLGDLDGAEADYAAAVAIATVDVDHERAWARALATYLLDHEGDIGRASAIAAAELELRRDVGAYDLAAWAAYRAGDLAAARTNIDQAIAFDVGDASIRYHAAVISAAEGDDVRARHELKAVLELNGNFHPLLAERARKLLIELEEGPAWTRPATRPG